MYREVRNLLEELALRVATANRRERAQARVERLRCRSVLLVDECSKALTELRDDWGFARYVVDVRVDPLVELRHVARACERQQVMEHDELVGFAREALDRVLANDFPWKCSRLFRIES